MNLHFLFPAHPLRPTDADDAFADQIAALSDAGFSCSLLPDPVIEQGKRLRNLPAGAVVVYRGWMFNAAQYARLVDAIDAASATPLTSHEQYLAAHHLPNWYPLISEFTPETAIFPPDADLQSELQALGWEAFFVKDYVKSLKTSAGSIVRDASQVARLVADMKRFRGEIEGGFCIRRVEPFIAASERRYFVLHGQPFAADGGAVPDLVTVVASRIPSPFFSIDLIERDDGILRVVEVGDGQVSDLVGWSAGAFAAMWARVQPPGAAT